MGKIDWETNLKLINIAKAIDLLQDTGSEYACSGCLS